MSNLESIPEHLREHFQHIHSQLHSLDKKVESGFPEGDLAAHRKVHEQYIKDAAERASLWKSVREKTITGMVWACLILFGSACWEYIRILVKH